MADLTAANVTVTVEEQNIVNGKRRNRVKITFGDGALTYPAAGVPMPTFDKFGMKRNLDYLTIFDENDAVGQMFKYDMTNNKIRMYEFDYPNAAEGPALELDGGTDAVAAQTLFAEAVGW